MINFQVSGSLPVVNADLSEKMKQIAKLMEDSIRQNFIEGGRPSTWQLTKEGGNPFYPLGKLYNSIRSISDKNSATAWAGDGLIYARRQQLGGYANVPITEKSRSFFWMMFFRTKDYKWKWMALTQRSVFMVYIPPRPYVMFQQEDIAKILDLIGTGIITFEQIGSTSTAFN